MKGPRGVILMYHRVAELSTDPWALSVTPQHFGEHLDVIRKRTSPLKVGDLGRAVERGEVLPSSVAVTFDDGYSDNFYNARPLLQRFDVPATIFLATSFLGSKREYWWDDLDRLFLQPGTLPPQLRLTLNEKEEIWDLGGAADYSNADFQPNRSWRTEQPSPGMRQELYRSIWQTMQRMPAEDQDGIIAALVDWAGVPSGARPGCRPMTIDEVVELAQTGLIEVGAHTMTHPVLSAIAPDRQRDEIQRSKARVEEITRCAVPSFAYPYGDVSEVSVDALKDAGLRAACTTKPGCVQADADPLRMPRMHVGDWDGAKFEQRLSEWFET